MDAYLDIDDIVRVALEAKPMPSIPGTDSCRRTPSSRGLREAGIIFIGPTPEIMRTLGNKVAARELAVRRAYR